MWEISAEAIFITRGKLISCERAMASASCRRIGRAWCDAAEGLRRPPCLTLPRMQGREYQNAASSKAFSESPPASTFAASDEVSGRMRCMKKRAVASLAL